MGKPKFKPNAQKSRKQLRKEERKNKKIRRHEYYTNRRKPGQFVLLKKPEEPEKNRVENPVSAKKQKQFKEKPKPVVEDERDKEKKQQLKLQQQMSKQRNKQLVEANLDEDRNIKRLEKQLKLNKRKSKAIPASFSQDGLDYLLEVCEPENLKNSAAAEQHLMEVNNEFEEDLVLMTGDNKNAKLDEEIDSDDYSISESEEIDVGTKKRTSALERQDRKRRKNEEMSDSESEEEMDSDAGEISAEIEEESDDNEEELEEEHDENGEEMESETNDVWEDIYGRLRSKDGAVINEKVTNKDISQKYIPPGARLDSDDAKKLDRLKKQLKGLVNRLAESNMHSITNQIEELYMSNSRHDMNHTITNLVVDALVSPTLSPERLLMEHILLIVILHANVGTEVGAHFLQTIVKMFNDNLAITDPENKKLDNLVIILAQLYNFKLFEAKLIFEIIRKLSESFEEKNVECILHILRSVGFNLRKDDPIALKDLILSLQKKASGISSELQENARVKFMLDILLAIKNNNVTKIPNYDTTYSEHLKKIMKGFIRKGNYVTQLNISLEDLLKADVKGKWWIVGSAWTGNSINSSDKVPESTNTFSQRLLALAAKQRMNTDVRKQIFCIIMSAEDYLDAFEKLLHLSLKNQQEREIIHVLLHCCLQEKTYNPYYSTLAQKFCETDRKYQMMIKCSIWDKLKALKDHSAGQISNLAKLLSHLIIEKSIPISTLKIVQFSELDKITLRFIRQILLGILLHDDTDTCKEVFEKVAHSDKLKMFRESLRLFLHHFLLKNLSSQGIPEDKKEIIQQRVKIVEKLLTGKDRKLY